MTLIQKEGFSCMGIFTQRVFIPRPLYFWMPFIYLLTGVLMWLVFSHALVKLMALMLMAFALYITVKRFSSTTDSTARSRARRRPVRPR